MFFLIQLRATVLCILAIIICQCSAKEILVATDETVNNCTACITLTQCAQLDLHSHTIISLHEGNYTLKMDFNISHLVNITFRGTDVVIDCGRDGFRFVFEYVTELFVEGITFVSCDSPGVRVNSVENAIFREITVTNSNGTAMIIDTSENVEFYNFVVTNNELWILQGENDIIIQITNSSVTFQENTTLSFNRILGNITRPEQMMIMTCPEPTYNETVSAVLLAKWTNMTIYGVLTVVNNTSPTSIIRIDQSSLNICANAAYNHNIVGIYGVLGLFNTQATINGASDYSLNTATQNDIAGSKTVAGIYISCSTLFADGPSEFSHNKAGVTACSARNSANIIMRGVVCHGNGPPDSFVPPPAPFDEQSCGTCVRDDFGFNSIMYLFNTSQFSITGSEFSENNDCFVLVASRSIMQFDGENTFEGNTAVIYSQTSSFVFTGILFVRNNSDRNSAIFSYSAINLHDQSRLVVNGDFLFKDNIRPYSEGGVVFSRARSQLIFGGNGTFEENSARVGGVFYLQDDSFVIVLPNTIVTFVRNMAIMGGGVMYLSRYERFCDYGTFSSYLPCFINFEDSNSSIIFSGNRAGKDTGSVLHSNVQVSINTDVIYTYHRPSIIPFNFTKPLLDSDFYQLYFCENRTPVYDDRTQNRIVRRGEMVKVQVAAIAFTGNAGTSHLVRSSFTKNMDMDIDHFFSRESHWAFDNCSDLTFQVFSPSSFEEIAITANGFCNDDVYCLRINLTFAECQDGFELATNQCVCDERIRPYTENCDVTTGEILKTESNPWIGAYRNTTDPNSSTILGVITYKKCPFDYCLDPEEIEGGEVSLTLSNVDAQCSPNRTGRLCGACAKGTSLGLHSSYYCRDCSNNATITLILAMGALGIIFVAFVSLSQFTVSSGAIHGLLFYANMVGANNIRFGTNDQKVVFFDVFIGWINLDFGFDVCLHNGLTQVLYIAYQFIFPLYLCAIVLFIGLLCRYSIRASKFFAKINDPVAMLETIVLFSYNKTARNIIDILSVAKVEYPPEAPYDYVIVWKRDGTVDYATGAHAALVFVAIVLGLIMIFLTLVAFLSQWLYKSESISKVFHRYHISALLRTYHAAFKPVSRYWVSLCLILRWILLLTFALDTSFYISLLAITTACTLLLSIIGVEGGIYNNRRLDALEISFIVNLLLYSVGTYHVKATMGSSVILTYISTGTAFLTFFIVLCVLIYQRLSKVNCVKKYFLVLKGKIEKTVERYVVTESLESVVAKEIPMVTIQDSNRHTRKTGQEIRLMRFSRLRETLLED